jgi:phosphatidylglycerol:prolipoprotein diacylglycerol transferase
MGSILFQVGSSTLHSYTAFVLLGVGLALWLVRLQLRQQGAPDSLLWGALLWTLACGLVTARGLYVILHWQDFEGSLLSSLQIERGGLLWYGGLVGGAFGLYLHTYLKRLSFRQWADIAAPAVALGYAIGQIGCFLSNFCYGAPYAGPLSLELPDIYGLVDFRYPTQLMAVATNLAIAVILWKSRRTRPFAGFSALLFLILFSFAQGFLEFTRGDESLYLGGYRLAQTLSWAILTLSVAGMVVLWRRLYASKSLASPPRAAGR